MSILDDAARKVAPTLAEAVTADPIGAARRIVTRSLTGWAACLALGFLAGWTVTR